MLNIFLNNVPNEKSIWLLAFQFFLSQLKINANDKDKNFIFKNEFSLFLYKIIENEIFPFIYILEVIKEINLDIPLILIEGFYLKALEK